MIENISYDDMINYSKELKASADVIAELIKNKELSEIQNFVDEVSNYSKYLESIVKLYKDADNNLLDLRSQKGASH